MGTNEEKTLEINRFPGIDRFDEGTITPPNYFETLQNYHPKSLGELESISGVIDITEDGDTDVPGVDRFIHTVVHKDFGGQEKLLAFFKPDIDDDTDFGEDLIDSSLFAVNGGSGSETRSFYVVLYGPGGVCRTIEVFNITAAFVNATITFTVPTGLPDFVCQINIFQIGTGTLSTSDDYNAALSVSIQRRGGVFPASADFSPARVNSGTGLNQITPSTLKVMGVVNDAEGSLIPGNIYYLGIASAMAPNTSNYLIYQYPRCRLFTNQGVPLSFLMPTGGTGVNIRYFFEAPVSVTGISATRAWHFIGITPEDVLAGGYVDSDDTLGVITSQGAPFSGVAYAWSSGTSVSTIDDTIAGVFLTNIIADAGGSAGTDEFPVYLTSSSGGNLPGGLAVTTSYWIKVIDFDGAGGVSIVKLAASLEDLKNGSFIDITSAGSSYTSHTFTLTVADVYFREVPVNTNNGVTMVQNYTVNPRRLGESEQQAEPASAPSPARADGVFINAQFFPSGVRYLEGTDVRNYPYAGSGEVLNLGCWVLPNKQFDDEAYQLLANINEKNFSRTGEKILLSFGIFNPSSVAPIISPSLFWRPEDDVLSSKQLTLRTYLANNDNGIFYTNGYVLKPIIRSDSTVRIPTSKYITSFDARLVVGGGSESWQNTKNQVYYSGPDLPFNWGASAPNTFNVFSQQDINGFGAYSQNLTTSGFAQYLLISKKDALFSWSGDTQEGPQQLYFGFGMASPGSFIETDFGPILIARDNVYALQGGRLQDIGDNIEPILKSLSEEQLEKIVAVYHDKKIKFGYPSVAGEPLDREFWLELRTERGENVRYYSGPHILKSYDTQASTIIFGEDRDLRFSALGKRLYLRDTGSKNDTDSIDRKIVISRLTMDATHFQKLITQLYMATSVVSDETYNICFEFEDGTQQYIGALASLSVRSPQLCQMFIKGRVRGRIVKLVIENSSSTANSIYNISILYEIFKRRLLRYQ